MFTLLAHAGHDHGPNETLIALLVAVVVLAIVAAGAAADKARTRRTLDRRPPKGAAR